MASKQNKGKGQNKQKAPAKKGGKKKEERKVDEDEDKYEEKENSNTRGIPQMTFVENPYNLVYNGTHERYLTEVDERLAKYRLMENQLLKQQMAKEDQKSEMEKNLKACKYFESKKESEDELQTNFNVSEQLYANATIDKPCDKVAIWLGAKVMLEFTLDEAMEFLNERISTVSQAIEVLKSDVNYTRKQINIAEVNRSRVYNAGIKVKKAKELSNQR